MKDDIERRTNERCNHQASVTYAYFNADRFYHTEATNHSQEGINFFSDFPLKAGSSIYVRIRRIKMEFKNKGGIETYIIQRVALLTPVILKAFFATNYPTLPRSHQKKNYNQSTKQ